jgi:putative ABC transport system ATP-binding protein
MVESHINVQGLTKRFRRGPEEVVPFENIDLAVERGSVTAIIGPSGSGKSTLLNCLAGIEVPDAGHLHIDGVDVGGLGSGARDRWRSRSVGLVFQAFNLIDVLDARGNVLLGLAGRRPARADRARADDLLGRVGLGDRIRHRPSQLSGGQQQRVAIARALIHKPPLVLADEPTGNLDASGAHAITELLVSVARDEGSTVVIVTHDNRVAKVADRVLRMDAGTLRPLSPEELLEAVA